MGDVTDSLTRRCCIRTVVTRLGGARLSLCAMAGNGATDDLEYDLTKQSVGYLSKEDYKRKREELEHEKALNALKRIAGAPAPALPFPSPGTAAALTASASGCRFCTAVAAEAAASAAAAGPAAASHAGPVDELAGSSGARSSVTTPW